MMVTGGQARADKVNRAQPGRPVGKQSTAKALASDGQSSVGTSGVGHSIAASSSNRRCMSGFSGEKGTAVEASGSEQGVNNAATNSSGPWHGDSFYWMELYWRSGGLLWVGR